MSSGGMYGKCWAVATTLLRACTKAQIRSVKSRSALLRGTQGRGGAPAAGEGCASHDGFCSAKEVQQRKQMMIL